MTYIDFWRSRLAKMIFNPLNYCLGLGIVFSFALLIFRMEWSGNARFVFLVWNLFLAGLPLVASTTLKYLHEVNRMRWYLVLPVAGFWLLFLPNAPYILTDLFHLHKVPGIPLWYDLMLILSFAWNGLMFGLISLLDVHKIVNERKSAFAGWLTSIGVLILSSFGIYLGRFLRWNSWDIISEPEALFRDVIHPILHPFQNPTPVGVTLCFSAFLILAYVTIYSLLKNVNTASLQAK